MRAISATLTAAFVCTLTVIGHPCDTNWTSPRQVPTAPGGQVPAALVVLGQEVEPDEERLRDLGHRPGGQPEPAGDHVQPGRPVGHRPQVLPLGRPEADLVDLVEDARP